MLWSAKRYCLVDAPCPPEVSSRTLMEMMNELIPFAQEMLGQRPNRKMLKIYAIGMALAFFGVVVGLVETVCSPFTSGEAEERMQEVPSPQAQCKDLQKLNDKEKLSPKRYRKPAL